MSTDIELALSQLREAYRALARGPVPDQRQLAEGLIAPAIRRLESAALHKAGECVPEGWNTDLESAPRDEDPILIAIKGVKLPWNDTDVIVRQARYRDGGAWCTDFDAYYPKDIIGWRRMPAPPVKDKGE